MDDDESDDYLIEIRKCLSKSEFRQICQIDAFSFPKRMRESQSFLRRIIANKRAIRLIVINEEDEIVGYLFALPHNDAYSYTKKYDSRFEEDDSALYLERVAIVPQERQLGGFSKLFECLVAEARRQGYKKITMHARSAALAPIMEKYGARKLYTIENCFDGGEPSDYIEYIIE